MSQQIDELEIKNSLNIGKERKKIGVEMIKGQALDSNHDLVIHKNLIDNLVWRLQNYRRDQIRRSDHLKILFTNISFQFSHREMTFDELKDFDITRWKETELNQSEVHDKQLQECIANFNKEINVYSTKVKQFQQQVQKLIVEDILTNSLAGHNKIIAEKFQQIRKLQQSIQESTKESEKLMEKFLKQTNLVKEDVEQYSRPKKNILDDILEYLILVNKIVSLIKEYAQICTQVFQESLLLEKKRFLSFKNSFLSYFQLQKDVLGFYEEAFHLKSISQFQSIDENKLADYILQFETILTLQEQRFLKNKTKEEEITLGMLMKFFNSLNCETFNEITKFFQIKFYDGIIKKGSHKGQSIVVMITVDFYVSIYTLKDEFFDQHVMSCQIEKTKMELKKDILKLTYQDKGLLWNSKKEIILELNEMKKNELFHQYQHYSDIFKQRIELEKLQKNQKNLETKNIASQTSIQQKEDESVQTELQLQKEDIQEQKSQIEDNETETEQQTQIKDNQAETEQQTQIKDNETEQIKIGQEIEENKN